MSNDEGNSLDRTSDEDFRAKFNALCDHFKLSFAELCRRAHIEEAVARRAIEQGTYGLPATLTTLNPLLAVVQLDLSWLVTGQTPRVLSADTRRLELFELCYQFCLRNEVPRNHRRALIGHVMSKLDSFPVNSVRMAARPGVPRTMTDVGYEYQRLISQGVIQ